MSTRKNGWTTDEETKYLRVLVPKFLAPQLSRDVGLFLSETVVAFFNTFPARASELTREIWISVRSQCLLSTWSYSLVKQKLHTWFGNQNRETVKGNGDRHKLDLSGRANRRPIPLQTSQAYSSLYYSKGSLLYIEIHSLYQLYQSGDTATLSRYRHLFMAKPSTPTEDGSPAVEWTLPAGDETSPATEKSTNAHVISTSFVIPPFVHFQQTLLREKVKTMSSDEAADVTRHIEECHVTAIEVWEKPWLATSVSAMLPVGSTVPNKPELTTDELEAVYYQK